ncbi:glycerol acyltransferase, partial [Aquimarina celericrescens]|nr:glycerol acyltransferase [Aquimarina celericrescens]
MQEKRIIKVRIGNPVSVKDQLEYANLEDFTTFMRKKTYMLANPFEKKTLRESIPQNLKLPKASKSPKKIAVKGSINLIESELE